MLYIKNMLTRTIATELQAAAKEYPVTTVFGPRQSGKTTLARMTFPEKPYCSLEDPDTRRAATLDPRAFLKGFPEGAIFDEIQHTPELLSYIQGLVDLNPVPGRYLLTGSRQPSLHEAVSQSLAGRTAILTLLPFSFEELKNYNVAPEAFPLMVTGGFPRLHENRLAIDRFFNGYVQTYLERDVRSLIRLKDLGRFQQFLTLLSGRIGQLVNYNSVSNDIGVSPATVKNWISVLKASFVIFELQPWFMNVGKRVMKSPKIYFTDTGLAAFLLGITDAKMLARDPLRGGLYENFVIIEFLKAHYNRGKRPALYFYRDSHGNEVDLLVKQGNIFVPVEIKSAQTFTESFLRGIERFTGTVGAGNCRNAMVCFNGDVRMSVRGVEVFNPLRHRSIDEMVNAGFPDDFKT